MKNFIVLMRKRRWHYAYLFISPVLIFFGLFRVYPAIQTLVLRFFDVNIITRKNKWVALKNFLLLLEDSSFIKAIYNTFIFAFYILILAAFIGLVLAEYRAVGGASPGRLSPQDR